MRSLFKSTPRPLLKSDLGPLARHGTHQDTISVRPEQFYLPFDPSLEWPGEGALSDGQNAAIVRVILWAIMDVRPVALGQSVMVPTRKPQVEDLNRCILHLIQY